MFRRIVTELAYSPALAEKAGEYSKWLRREKSRRQIGLPFILLSVVMHLFIIILPPEAANTANPASLLDSEVHSPEDFLRHFDQNTRDIRDIMSSLNIRRTDIQNTTLTKINLSSDVFYWTTSNLGSGKTYTFRGNEGPQAAYYQPFSTNHSLYGQSVTAYAGKSPTGWFAIMKNDGSLITNYPKTPPCTPANDDIDNLPLSTAGLECDNPITTSLSAYNISSGLPASTSSQAHASDRIAYTVHAKNTGGLELTTPLEVNLSDTLEYSQLLNTGGGSFEASTETLSWQPALLQPGESVEKSFTVRVLPSVPSTARGEYNTRSYDCVMSASFGSNLDIPVNCPLAKSIERLTSSLPTLPITIGIIFAATLLGVSVYLYARSKQLAAEMRIIRRHSGPGEI